MKKMKTLMIAAMAFGVAGTAVASTTCHRILAKDHVLIGVKGRAGPNKFYEKPSQVMESPLLPTGEWALHVKNGGEYPLYLSVKNPAICGKKIEYQVRLVYKGKTLINKDQAIRANQWSLLYASKAQNIRILIMADHKG